MKHGAGILFTDGAHILLLKRAADDQDGNTWGLPGGCSHKYESPYETATRETKEECGLSHIPGKQFDNFEQKYPEFTWTTFLYEVSSTFEIESLSDEHSDWKWFTFANLQEINLHPKLKPQIEGYLNLIRKKFGKKFDEWLKYSSLLVNFK